MLESTIQRAIQRYVRSRGGYVLKIHGSEFQPAAIDLFICYKGLFIGVETKRPGEEPTPMQRYVIAEIIDAGGKAFWTTELKAVKRVLDEIDASGI